MAVGKGSMARASRAATAAETASKTTSKAAKGAEAKEAAKPAAKRSTRSTARTKKAESHVVAAPSEQVMERIVYQESFQVLNRDAKPGETFGVGDAMPVYYF